MHQLALRRESGYWTQDNAGTPKGDRGEAQDMALLAYLDSVKSRDPAPRSRWEVLLYPGAWALALHRVAHFLFGLRLFFVARLVNHLSRFLTAIDIHPGATIGRNFFIDHGFVVIGETAVIGDNVTIYQCVTLGGTDPANGVAGKRHPTLEDGVIIGSGAQVLGPITVGRRARVGANAVVTRDVAEGAQVRRWSAFRRGRCRSMLATMPNHFCPMGRHVPRSSTPRHRNSNCCAAKWKRCEPGSMS